MFCGKIISNFVDDSEYDKNHVSKYIYNEWTMKQSQTKTKLELSSELSGHASVQVGSSQ